MTAEALAQGFAVDFLTSTLHLFSLATPMRQSLRIRIEFAPGRLSTQYLRSAYELLSPVVRRVVSERAVEQAHCEAAGRLEVNKKGRKAK